MSNEPSGCDEHRQAHRYASVLLDVPIAEAFDYRIPDALADVIGPGDWVVVPWGRQRKVGIVWACIDQPSIAANKVRDLLVHLSQAPRLSSPWLKFGEFAASYYHCTLGELLIPAIPKRLRTPAPLPGKARRRKASDVFELARHRFDKKAGAQVSEASAVTLTGDQRHAYEALTSATGYQCWLLHGITGSGKTEVYIQWLRTILAADLQAQVLILVPEIALTPRLATELASRLDQPCAILHSAMTDSERAGQWLACAEGRARVVIGTRLAVLAPLPNLKAVVIDEEHDPSFKQQEHPHYSARDLAVARAHQLSIPIVLGSATPSLESWFSARKGRYGLLSMTERATGAAMPSIDVIALRESSSHAQRADAASTGVPEGLNPEAFDALKQTISAGEQSLVFLNRRGFAPVLTCSHCGWLSQCDACSAYRVVHRTGKPSRGAAFALVCHHCASNAPVPRRCPSCGDPELSALGRGTQRIEETLAEALPDARVARLDRDVARRVGATESVFERLHRGEIDIIIGTQMLAKGHDVQKLSLVIVLDPDGALFSSDFRGPERLFALLTQVAGRAGRHARPGRVLVQTRFVDHPVFEALLAHDYAPFADALLQERREANLPPFTHHAMLRAQAKDMDLALDFLKQAANQATSLLAESQVAPVLYDPVPMPMARVAGINRAQLLVESASRPALHAFLRAWRQRLSTENQRVRWQLEIDPVEI